MPSHLRQAQPDDPGWRIFLALFNQKKPLNTSQIARLVGLPRNTTYYHLEALRTSGLALRSGKLWLCQPLFLDEKKMDLVLPAWQVVVLAVVEKMEVPPGVDPAATARGCLRALHQLFDIPNGN